MAIWFPMYSSDFIGATAGHSLHERGIYALMLIFYYEVGPFPLDPPRVYRIVGCETEADRHIVDYLLSHFFVKGRSGWIQKRAERVKEDMQRSSDRARAKANKRWGGSTFTATETSPKGPENVDAAAYAAALPQHMPEQSSSNAPAMLSTSTSTSTSKTTSKATADDGGERTALIHAAKPAEQSSPPTLELTGDTMKTKAGKKKALRTAPRIAYDPLASRIVGIDEATKRLWQEAFPSVDIDSDVRRMEVWLKANPSKRPRSGYESFMVKWFTKHQNDAAATAARTATSINGNGYVGRRAALEAHNDRVADDLKRKLAGTSKEHEA
jgi:uncharacterized protein YdaU (DUF1376 family)